MPITGPDEDLEITTTRFARAVALMPEGFDYLPDIGETVQMTVATQKLGVIQEENDEEKLRQAGYVDDEGGFELVKDRPVGNLCEVRGITWAGGSQGLQFELADPDDPHAESFMIDEADLADGRYPFIPIPPAPAPG